MISDCITQVLLYLRKEWIVSDMTGQYNTEMFSALGT